MGSGMKNETSITKSFSTIDEHYTITQCSNGYILEINGRDKKDDYLNIKHLMLKHEELVDVLIEVDQAIRNQRSSV
jgi:7,8-dihydro-6-hydroxymethylpterin-pyrophosphokinase